MVLDYLKKTKKAKPELQMKAEGFINSGYQQVITYEVKGGGFSWFGQAPAHKVLTAYGLIMFNDMAKVHNVDRAIIQRTQNWLAGLQKADGSWDVDQGGIAEGIINRQSDVLRVSAYITWALAETGYQGPQIAKGLAYLRQRMDAMQDPYGMAVIANAFIASGQDVDAKNRAVQKLADMAKQDDKTAYWQSAAPTFTDARGNSADLEATGLATYAIVKAGTHPGLATKALTYLTQKKDAFGTWSTTQATVWSMKALIYATERGAGGEVNGEITVRANGKDVTSFAVTPENADVMRQIELKDVVREGANDVQIQFSGKGSLSYQISSKHYVPWQFVPRPAGAEPLDIEVKYDRTELNVNDTATVKVSVTNRFRLPAKMVIVNLGIPPGFEVESGDLAELVGNKIERFSQTGREVIVYISRINPNQTIDFTYRVKAKFPLRAKTPSSLVYEYYTPEVKKEAKPVELVVKS